MANWRILVVDDEPAILDLIGLTLRSRGYDVETFSCPLEAIEHLRERPDFDLILSDVTMPVICGPEFIRVAVPFCRNANVVMMTGFTYLKVADIPRCVAILPKPFRLDTLLSVVLQALPREQEQATTAGR